jgi:ferredoxin-NADP reductase
MKCSARIFNTLTDEKKRDYENGRIDYTFLKEKIDNFKQHFYVCGPPQFVTAISEALIRAKTDTVV